MNLELTEAPVNEQQLRYLVAAVETGTFTAAAERCFIAQPSLSSAIAKLEREAGTPLFHRVGRNIKPTAACEALLPSARDALRAIDVARRTLTAADKRVVGVLDLAIQPTLVVDPVTILVARFRDLYPDVRIRLRSTSDQESVIERVSDGRSELGIGDVLVSPGLTWRTLGQEQYIVIRPADAGLATGTAGTGPPSDTPPDHTEQCDARDLAGYPMVIPPTGSPTRAVLEDVFAKARVPLVIAVEVDHREALIPLVRAGVGGAIIPESMLEPQNTDGLTVSRLVPAVRRRMGLVHRSVPLTPAATAFKRLAVDTMRSNTTISR